MKKNAMPHCRRRRQANRLWLVYFPLLSSFTPQTWRSRAIARETLLEKLRFRYFSAGFASVHALALLRTALL
jgi:hypothetical protein